jgi:hypothetical protein
VNTPATLAAFEAAHRAYDEAERAYNVAVAVAEAATCRVTLH